MIHYCIEDWGGKPLTNPQVLWPIFGSFEDWVCQQLSIWVNSKRPPTSPEEREYASMWIGLDTRTHLFPFKREEEAEAGVIFGIVMIIVIGCESLVSCIVRKIIPSNTIVAPNNGALMFV